MSNQDPWHHAWTSIDQTSDPNWFVRFLDGTRGGAKKAAESNPRQFFAFMDIQEGYRILDIGCGTGDLTKPLAQLVGHGEVVGVDFSATMIAEASQRAHNSDLPLRFEVGDVQHMNFPDNSFDRSYASAVFQHIEDPRQGLSEMIRVTKPGGRVIVVDNDWETFVITADDDVVSRKLMGFFCDGVRNGGIAHHLPVLFRDAGLTQLSVEPITIPFLGPNAGSLLETWVMNARRAAAAGVVSEHEADTWVADVSKRIREERLFSAFTMFRISGVKS
jgi:SAM-dependent methyltransferase